jgi:hypothetical protein
MSYSKRDEDSGKINKQDGPLFAYLLTCVV